MREGELYFHYSELLEPLNQRMGMILFKLIKITVAAKGRMRTMGRIRETSQTTELMVAKNEVVQMGVVNSSQIQNIGGRVDSIFLWVAVE